MSQRSPVSLASSFWLAATLNDLPTVTSLLGNHLPGNSPFPLNWPNPKANQWSSLHTACFNGNLKIAELILARLVHVEEVNQQDVFLRTPFYVACSAGNIHVVEMLLRDHRVDVNLADQGGRSPVKELYLGKNGHTILEMILASGRELKEASTNSWGDDEEMPKSPQLKSLIGEFQRDPEETRFRLWKKLGLREARAAELFALTVLHCDGYLVLKERESEDERERRKRRKFQRFFSVIARLPMELQMVLCNRAMGLGRSLVGVVEVEEAVRKEVCW